MRVGPHHADADEVAGKQAATSRNQRLSDMAPRRFWSMHIICPNSLLYAGYLLREALHDMVAGYRRLGRLSSTSGGTTQES